jgi:hypothetical protein
MKLKNFYSFIESKSEEIKPKQGFDWFNQNYLTNNGWKKKDKVGANFEHISPSGGYFHLIFKEDSQLGEGFELSETIGQETTQIKTSFEKENCWEWFKTWMKQTLNKPKTDQPKPDEPTYKKIYKFFKD